MVKINCDVTNCSHNNNKVCFANLINIGGKNAKKDCNTCCGSFLDEKNYSKLTNNINDMSNQCTSLTCNVVSCAYNSNNLCTADTIQVSGKNPNLYTETYCSTFKQK
jgi:uncharacterized protein DUF1540